VQTRALALLLSVEVYHSFALNRNPLKRARADPDDSAGDGTVVAAEQLAVAPALESLRPLRRNALLQYLVRHPVQLVRLVHVKHVVRRALVPVCLRLHLELVHAGRW